MGFSLKFILHKIKKINKGEKGIGKDFDFATNCVNSKLVTVAHQDDIYDYDYAKTSIISL